ncbi:hypothetical protein HMPREF3150_02762 [Pseudomonas aeruginosa]|nr:hypothetical protein HMPREF3150_02762 [Pseudomonas aeruginosa]
MTLDHAAGQPVGGTRPFVRVAVRQVRRPSLSSRQPGWRDHL